MIEGVETCLDCDFSLRDVISLLQILFSKKYRWTDWNNEKIDMGLLIPGKTLLKLSDKSFVAIGRKADEIMNPWSNRPRLVPPPFAEFQPLHTTIKPIAIIYEWIDPRHLFVSELSSFAHGLPKELIRLCSEYISIPDFWKLAERWEQDLSSWARQFCSPYYTPSESCCVCKADVRFSTNDPFPKTTKRMCHNDWFQYLLLLAQGRKSLFKTHDRDFPWRSDLRKDLESANDISLNHYSLTSSKETFYIICSITHASISISFRNYFSFIKSTPN